MTRKEGDDGKVMELSVKYELFWQLKTTEAFIICSYRKDSLYAVSFDSEASRDAHNASRLRAPSKCQCTESFPTVSHNLLCPKRPQLAGNLLVSDLL